MKQSLGVSSNQTVHDLVAALLRDGYLVRSRGQRRGLQLAGDQNDKPGDSINKPPAYGAHAVSFELGGSSSSPISPSGMRVEGNITYKLTGDD
jgi:hypothetical protein